MASANEKTLSGETLRRTVKVVPAEMEGAHESTNLVRRFKTMVSSLSEDDPLTNQLLRAWITNNDVSELEKLAANKMTSAKSNDERLQRDNEARLRQTVRLLS